MLIFTNPTLIDINAVLTLGASAKLPGSFGRFGTGLKYSIATILRAGGEIRLYRGLEEYHFSTRPITIRDREFDCIIMYTFVPDPDADPQAPDNYGLRKTWDLNITTSFGRDWKPWMVLRELACNALDEGGEFRVSSDSELAADLTLGLAADRTTITVEWPDLQSCYHHEREQLFLHERQGDRAAVLASSAALRVLPGPSSYLFYRGVRVCQLERQSAFTYDILAEMMLTEDRTLYGAWQADQLLRDFWLSDCRDRELVFKAVTASGHESAIDYTQASWGKRPTRAFLDAVADARAQDKLANDHAKKILLRSMREEEADRVTYKTVDESAHPQILEQILSHLDHLGISFSHAHSLNDDYDPARPRDTKFVLIDSDQFPNPDMVTMLESGRVYIQREYVEGVWQPGVGYYVSSKHYAALTQSLIERWIELNSSTLEEAVKLVSPVLINALGKDYQREIGDRLTWERDDKQQAAGTTETELEQPAVPVEAYDEIALMQAAVERLSGASAAAMEPWETLPADDKERA